MARGRRPRASSRSGRSPGRGRPCFHPASIAGACLTAWEALATLAPLLGRLRRVGLPTARVARTPTGRILGAPLAQLAEQLTLNQ
jgi:hypothetical protein